MVLHRPKILLIEDNSNDVELIRIALTEQLVDFDLKVMMKGNEVMSLLDDLSDLPDLVLLDLNLPQVSGLEVLKKIRASERLSPLPVVIFTNSRTQKDLIECYNLGANAFIRKALEPAEFKEALKNLDVYWLVKET